jgi:uncharacterized protein YndB with AHSA1/START domain
MEEIMSDKSFTTSFIVSQSSQQVFAAITNPRAWWGEGITGETVKLGGEFVYRHGSIHLSTQKITELVPNKKVVWKITQSQLSFAFHKSEWTGTEVIFEIAKKGDKTELKVTHAGLVPQFECFEACSGGWNFYLGDSLKSLIETGKGEPDSKSKAAA